MKAYYVGIAGQQGVSLQDAERTEPGYGQVALKMHAGSLNYRDLMIANNGYRLAGSPPVIALSDGAGEVAAIGPGVSSYQVGDRVIPIYMQQFFDGNLTEAKSQSALGGAIDGVLAEYVTVFAESLVRIPDHLTYQEAATLPCAAVTAWNALITTGNLHAGETVLLQGTGGVSIFALQFAKAAGARVIITSSSDAKLEQARAMGADDTINYRTNTNWAQVVAELTGGVGADVVLDVGGPATINNSLASVKYGGTVLCVGVLSGMSGEVMFGQIIRKNIRMQGISVGSRSMFEAMNRAISLNNIKPVIDKVFNIEQVAEAYAYLESGQHFGKVVVQIS